MAIVTCSCTTGMGNTGIPNCETLFKAQSGMFLVPITADDGTPNELDLSATWNQAFFDALVQNADASKRWYPVHNTKNVTSERADPITVTYDDTSTFKVQDGQRTFEMKMPNMGSVFYSKLNQNECIDMGFYPYDIDGNIRGQLSSDGTKLRPIKIAKGTWNTILMFAQDTTIPEVSLQFQLDRSVRDELLRLVLPSEMDNVDLSLLSGLFESNATYSAITTTGFTATLTTDYGTAKTPEKITGLVTADFTLAEISPAPGAIVITSATETPAASGIYVFVIPAETSGDVLDLNILTTKGYDSSDMANVTIP